jgi:hypothetical protein
MRPSDWDLDRTDEMPTGDRNQRRHARRGQCTASPLDIVRVLGPALRSHECDQPVEVGLCERFNRDLGHAASAARLVLQPRHRFPACDFGGASADPLSQGNDDPLWPAHVGHAPDVLVLTDAADQAVAVRSQPVDRRLQVVDFE